MPRKYDDEFKTRAVRLVTDHAEEYDTRYGLGASVWGAPGPDLDAIADRIEAGMVGVNRGLSTAAGGPWVGWKMSGLGYTRSVAGMRQFLQPQSQARRAG